MKNCCNERITKMVEDIEEKLQERGKMLEISVRDWTLIKNDYEQVDH